MIKRGKVITPLEDIYSRLTFDLGLLLLRSSVVSSLPLYLYLPRMEWAGRLLRTALAVVVRDDHVSKRSQSVGEAERRRSRRICAMWLRSAMPNHVGGREGGSKDIGPGFLVLDMSRRFCHVMCRVMRRL